MSHDSPIAAQSKTIGAINGKWAVLFRVVLVLATAGYPPLLAWATWMTVTQFADIGFREAGDRFTKSDAAHLELRWAAKFGEIPSHDFKARIIALETKTEGVRDAVSSMSERMVRIETLLTREKQ